MTEDFPAGAECTDEGEQNAELNKTARNRKTIAVQPFSERAGRVQMTNYFFVFHHGSSEFKKSRPPGGSGFPSLLVIGASGTARASSFSFQPKR